MADFKGHLMIIR